MSITYPPELLPRASPGDEADVLVDDGTAIWLVRNANLKNQPGTEYPKLVIPPNRTQKH